MSCKVNKYVCDERRDKYWGELVESEKIERLREVIKNLQIRAEEVRHEVDWLRNMALNHQHNPIGCPVVKVEEQSIKTRYINVPQVLLGEDKDKTYI